MIIAYIEIKENKTISKQFSKREDAESWIMKLAIPNSICWTDNKLFGAIFL